MVSWRLINAIFAAQFIIAILPLIFAYPYSKKHPHIKVEHGVKAGVLASLVYVHIYYILRYVFLTDIFSRYLSFFLIALILSSLFFGVIIGAFLGLLYTFFYTRLPSNSPIIKGMTLGAAYSLYGIFNNILVYMAISSHVGHYIDLSEYILDDILISILYILVFGFLIGKFWLSMNQEEEFFYPPKKMPSNMA